MVVGFANLDGDDYVDQLFVHKDLLRKRIATKLIEEIEREARRRGAASSGPSPASPRGNSSSARASPRCRRSASPITARSSILDGEAAEIAASAQPPVTPICRPTAGSVAAVDEIMALACG